MIRKVFVDGQVSVLLVLGEDGMEERGINPILEALSEQAERIETLEQQNRELVKQEELLTHLLKMTAYTGDLMTKSFQALRRLEASLDEPDSSPDSAQFSSESDAEG